MIRNGRMVVEELARGAMGVRSEDCDRFFEAMRPKMQQHFRDIGLSEFAAAAEVERLISLARRDVARWSPAGHA